MGSSLEKETQEEIQCTGHDRNHGDCNQWTSKSQCSRGESCSVKHDFLNKKKEKKQVPFDFRNEKTLERRRKRRYQKGKDTKVPVRLESQISRHVYRCQKGQCQKGSACGHGHPPECSHYTPKRRSTWRDTCGIKHTSKAAEDKNGSAIVALNNSCQGDAFSARSILKKIGSPPTKTKSECDIVAIRKDTSVQEKQNDFH